VELAGQARRELRGRAQAAWLARLRRDNVGAVLGWAADRGETEAGLRLAAFWDFAGHRREGLSWLERLLSAGGEVDPRAHAETLHAAASLAWRVGSYELAAARQRESLAAFRELRDPRGVANATRGMGIGPIPPGGGCGRPGRGGPDPRRHRRRARPLYAAGARLSLEEAVAEPLDEG
jgi:hypothetical protein